MYWKVRLCTKHSTTWLSSSLLPDRYSHHTQAAQGLIPQHKSAHAQLNASRKQKTSHHFSPLSFLPCLISPPQPDPALPLCGFTLARCETIHLWLLLKDVPVWPQIDWCSLLCSRQEKLSEMLSAAPGVAVCVCQRTCPCAHRGSGQEMQDITHQSAQVRNGWDVYIFKSGEIVCGSKLKKESPYSSFLAGILIMNLPKQLVGVPKQHMPHWDCPGGRGSVCASVLVRSLRPAKREKCSVIVMRWLKVIVFIPSQSTEILIG